MDDHQDAAQRQLDAYNAQDLDGFLACYSSSVVIEDDAGNVMMRGLDEMRERYGSVFAENPDLRASVKNRIRVGSYVVDEEHTENHPKGDVPVIVIYRLDADGLIDRVRFLR